MMSFVKKRKGFTLIELIVILAIIAILAAVLVPRFTGFTDSAKEKAIVSDAKTIITGATVFLLQNPSATKNEIEAGITEYTGDLDGELIWLGDSDTISFTFTSNNGYNIEVTNGTVGGPNKIDVDSP